MIWPRLRIRLQLVCACFDQLPLSTTRHALKQQKHSTGLQQAITEQLARGEELRRKQLIGHAIPAVGFAVCVAPQIMAAIGAASPPIS